jgi:hypothetical protein
MGYLASAMEAYSASQTDNDYRKAVGGAILNYFGAGAATPIVDAAVRPVSDKVMETGEEQNGVFGSFVNEPAGTVLSGNYNERDVFTSGLDPMNLFGGNPGGSVGGFVGQSVDPIGSIFGGDDTVANFISSLFD